MAIAQKKNITLLLSRVKKAKNNYCSKLLWTRGTSEITLLSSARPPPIVHVLKAGKVPFEPGKKKARALGQTQTALINVKMHAFIEGIILLCPPFHVGSGRVIQGSFNLKPGFLVLR